MQAFYKVRGCVYQGRGPTLTGNQNLSPVTAEDVAFFHGQGARGARTSPAPLAGGVAPVASESGEGSADAVMAGEAGVPTG
eukprot:11192-Alexandrium_andersonii.AAC.1